MIDPLDEEVDESSFIASVQPQVGDDEAPRKRRRVAVKSSEA